MVEQRWDDERRNREILALLRAAGFELVRTIKVWGQFRRRGVVRIMDNVFLRVAHFGDRCVRPAHPTRALSVHTRTPAADPRSSRRHRVPREALKMLHALPKQRNFGINLGYVRGRTGQRYVVPDPRSLFLCDPDANRTSQGC